MALKHIVGLDHVVAVVRDLDAAAARWQALGFTLSPRGTHSAELGTANYTIMFEEDYVELLGVLRDSAFNAPSRAFLERRGEGIERAAMTTTDAAAGVEEIRARGLGGTGPIDFGRPVTLPGGGETQARFRVFLWPVDEAPGGVRIFACQHVTPEAVWIPELLRHANTAQRIVRVEIASPAPDADAEHMARLLGSTVTPEVDGAVYVPTGKGRADFVFASRATLSVRYPASALTDVPERGAVSLVMAVSDLDAASRAVGPHGIKAADSLCVAGSAANGVLLCFVEE